MQAVGQVMLTPAIGNMQPSTTCQINLWLASNTELFLLVNRATYHAVGRKTKPVKSGCAFHWSLQVTYSMRTFQDMMSI